jgi:hypothetical protein
LGEFFGPLCDVLANLRPVCRCRGVWDCHLGKSALFALKTGVILKGISLTVLRSVVTICKVYCRLRAPEPGGLQRKAFARIISRVGIGLKFCSWGDRRYGEFQ